MNQTKRLYRIENLLHQQAIVSRARFLMELEVTPATFKRDLAYLRDRRHAPIGYDAERQGYRWARSAKRILLIASSGRVLLVSNIVLAMSVF